MEDLRSGTQRYRSKEERRQDKIILIGTGYQELNESSPIWAPSSYSKTWQVAAHKLSRPWHMNLQFHTARLFHIGNGHLHHQLAATLIEHRCGGSGNTHRGCSGRGLGLWLQFKSSHSHMLVLVLVAVMCTPWLNHCSWPFHTLLLFDSYFKTFSIRRTDRHII